MEIVIRFFNPRASLDYWVADVYIVETPTQSRIYCGVAKYGSTRELALREAMEFINQYVSRKEQNANNE